jgi:predicted AlkP superfamily phosphohydrolase/phosphomutase
MSRADGPRILAIGIDAAEPTLVRSLLERGDLPAMRGLLDEGVWGRVISPAPIGSGAVWPTFQTGRGPGSHGLYGEWTWKPDTMSLLRPTYRHLDPFWRLDVSRGRRVTVLDVPFAPLLDAPGCVEVLDWGAHDLLGGCLQVSPRELEPAVVEAGGIHPFTTGPTAVAGPGDRAGQARATARCVAGAEQRGRLARRLLADTAPDLFVMVFTEVHRASHLLWPPSDARPGETAGSAETVSGLRDLLMAIDREIGRLRELVGPDTAIAVFSLHGMRPAHGIPTILGPLLEAHGIAVRRPWRDRSLPEHAAGTLALLKRAVPGPAKRLYHRWTPSAMTAVLTQPSMPMPAYDWSRTVAFALPTDQHGWVRLNLRGREAQGSVEAARYDDMCRRVEAMLRGTRLVGGQALVRAVVRTAEDAATAAASPLPDLVVHWDDATFASPVRVAAPRIAAPNVGLHYTAQHAPQGFYLVRPGRFGRDGLPLDGAPVRAERLQHLFRRAAGWLD